LDQPAATTTAYTIPALDCAADESVIRARLGRVAGINQLDFDLVNRRLTVVHQLADEQVIVAELRAVGMTPKEPSPGPLSEEQHLARSWPGYIRLGLGGALAAGAEVASWLLASSRDWRVIAMAAMAILLVGMPTLRKGWVALATRTLNINFLMSVAVIGAFAIGEFPEAAMVIVLFAIAELIEQRSLERARRAIRELMELTPPTALAAGPDGHWHEMDVGVVERGWLVRVRPGQRIPLDGIIERGESRVDQSPITGESWPVEKRAGDSVYAGSIVDQGALEIRTTGGRDETTIARIVRMVQESQVRRAPTQRFVDAFARVYTPIVGAVALVVMIVPPLVLREPLGESIYRALVLLVIACPCALVISTPVTIVSGLAAAARQGILIKGGVYLEQARQLRVIALDKTGTLTEGRPRVTDVLAIGTASRESILRIAASLDALSDHPVARAIVVAHDGPLDPVSDFRAIAGRGVEGRIDDRLCFIGNHRMAEERGVCSPLLEARLAERESNAQTALVVGIDHQVIGVIAVADAPRTTSLAAVAALRDLGIASVLLSGDNQRTVDAVARAVGVDDARGDLLPEDKLAAIDQLVAQYGPTRVGMVGDGINDAPALARASLGVAMGAAGSDTALETAGVALMRDDLSLLPRLVRLSRRAATILRQNIILALGIKAIVFVLAIVGLATLWMAVFADVGASLLVVANGMRLLSRHDI
jgi:Cd2+/Zn2+-exporting ATPase